MEYLCEIQKFLSILNKFLGTLHGTFKSGLRMLRRIDDIVDIFRNINLCLVDDVVDSMNVFLNITLDLVNAFLNIALGLVNDLVDIILDVLGGSVDNVVDGLISLNSSFDVVDGFVGGIDDFSLGIIEIIFETILDILQVFPDASLDS